MSTTDVDTETEGRVVLAARWLVSELFFTVGERVEGKPRGFPTIAEAVAKYGLKKGEDADMLRLAEDMKSKALADVPPFVGRRDPVAESALSDPYRRNVYG